jgi:hypothetical protein
MAGPNHIKTSTARTEPDHLLFLGRPKIRNAYYVLGEPKSQDGTTEQTGSTGNQRGDSGR